MNKALNSMMKHKDIHDHYPDLINTPLFKKKDNCQREGVQKTHRSAGYLLFMARVPPYIRCSHQKST